ncbi:AAEL008162-PA [Aedes aegypti]|uniref:Aminopeptidase n=1 Tax=Aedes aegypti TaxID=7159 RepID=Q16ZL6_AEDAE|nr:AAEL008162-PA [Aedes aegypti]
MVPWKIVLLFAIFGGAFAERLFPTGKVVAPRKYISDDESQLEEDDGGYRLPKETVPSNYTIHLKTSVHQGDIDFQGVVDIHLDVVESTDKIVVNSRGLDIVSATLYSVEDGELVLLEQPLETYDEQTEQLTFQCLSTLDLGSYVLIIDYTGQLQSSGNGFFRRFYRDENNNRHYLATTQFEPTRARMAFPCYDEPTLKATFTVSITHHVTYNAVSNMPQDGPVVVDSEDPEFVTTTFQKTKRMSTYLLAFVVSDFETRQLGSQLIHARPNAIDETEFGLVSGDAILDALGEYTGVSYYDYKPKLAQIAIPDWGSGAMENWGLVTYGEPALLFNPKVSTYRTKTGVATTVAHELAHQWFGNLVTTDWWKYIWLNEGFANLYGYYGAHLAYPDEKYMDLHQIQAVHLALAQDSTETTRPMNWNANTPAEISALFDTIAYYKSGSVLNMFRIIFGDEAWRKGLKTYLLNRQLDVATDQDLYEALQSALSAERSIPTTMTVKEIMESWTNAAGYPVLNVRRNYRTNEVILSQQRFFSDKKLPNEHLWYIPYNYADQKNQQFEVDQVSWLTKRAGRIHVDVKPEQWLVFNRQQFGYYRVNYDARNWEMLTWAMIHYPESIHHYNRAQLIDDAFNLARAEVLDFNVALRLLASLINEEDYLPWAAGDKVLRYLHGKVRGTDLQGRFEYLVHTLIGNVYMKLNVESVDADETLKDKYLKQLISTWACQIGYVDCLEKTYAALKAVVDGSTEVHPDVSTVVYCYGVQHASDDEFLWLYNRMVDSKNEAYRSLVISALGCAQNKDHLNSYLSTAIGSVSEINYLDAERPRVIQAVYSNDRYGVDVLIDYLNTAALADDFLNRLGQSTLNSAISNIASRTNTEEELDRLKGLLETLGSHVPENVRTAALTTVQANFDWRDSLEGVIVADFLEMSGWK